MEFSFDEKKGEFSPSFDPNKEKILSFSFEDKKNKAATVREVFLKYIRFLYQTDKWNLREVMIKKHGFLQAYFYQDKESKNPLVVEEGIYLREISQERAYDLLIKTLQHFKPRSFIIVCK